MWRGAVARSLVSFRRANSNPNLSPNSSFLHPSFLNFPAFYFVDALVGRQRYLIQSSSIHSTIDPWKLGITNLFNRRKVSTGSVAATATASADSSAEASAVVGSFGSASSLLFPKPGYFFELFSHYGRCYWELSKARLSMLVVATSGAGYVLGSGHIIDFGGLCCTCAGTMMVAASANTLNQEHI